MFSDFGVATSAQFAPAAVDCCTLPLCARHWKGGGATYELVGFENAGALALWAVWQPPRIRAETGGGSIELNGVPAARAETGAGGIVAKFVASTGERADSVLETSAGDITVYLASDLAITIRASIELANGHNIRSDFPDIHVRTEGGDYGPKTVSADGRLNGGGPVLKVRTTTGDITFRRTSR